jgi:tetratricopeptide (TPR) repeat protein
MEVIQWLGAYLQEMQLHEKALLFYQKGQLLQPDEQKWSILIGNVHRGMGNFSQALQTYQKLHKENPDSLDALKALVRLSNDMGLKEGDFYRSELMRVERAMESSAASGGRKSKASAGSGRSRFGPPSRMGSSRPNTMNNPQPGSSSASYDNDGGSSDRGDYYSNSPRSNR